MVYHWRICISLSLHVSCLLKFVHIQASKWSFLYNIGTKMISSNCSYLGPNLICEGFVSLVIVRKLNTDGFVYNNNGWNLYKCILKIVFKPPFCTPVSYISLTYSTPVNTVDWPPLFTTVVYIVHWTAYWMQHFRKFQSEISVYSWEVLNHVFVEITSKPIIINVI